VNVTYQLDDELLKKAKLVAVRRGTSVAHLVREGLEQQVTFGSPMQRPGAQGTYEILVAYSLGEISRSVVMHELGLDHYRELLALLGVAGLPMPTVPAVTRAAMVKNLIGVLKAAGVLSEAGKRVSGPVGGAHLSPAQPIQIFIPDSGPLISLAIADELDLLMLVADDLRLIITDHVVWEVTRRDDLPDTHRTRAFIQNNSDRIEVMQTTIGLLARNTMQAIGGDQTVQRIKDLGELSISSAMIELRRRAPGPATLVLIEDEWFGNHSSRVGNAHLLSASAWLDGLEQIGAIQSASDVRRKILEGRRNFRVDFHRDSPAEKIEGGTECQSIFKP
jgi:hypothetical protein